MVEVLALSGGAAAMGSEPLLSTLRQVFLSVLDGTTVVLRRSAVEVAGGSFGVGGGGRGQQRRDRRSLFKHNL
jgi:hypothetical protein